MGAPLILSRISQTTLDILFTNHYTAGLVFGLSAGIGYLLAMLLLYEGMRQIEAMDLPEARIFMTEFLPAYEQSVDEYLMRR